MKKNILLLFFLASLQGYTQDVIFSQNFLVPETLNSSFTGAIRSTKVGAVFRSQWRNTAFKTNSNYAFFDTWFEGYKTGIGVSFLNQTESASTYTFNQMNLNYAMAFQISDAWYFRPNISAGFGMKNYGFQNLLLEDQINLNTSTVNTATLDPILLREQRNFFDFSSSILFNNEDSWIGLTIKHLNKPNISLTENGNVPLDVFWSVHTKYYLPFLENYRTWFSSKSKVYLLSNFMMQGKFNRLDIGGQYVFDDAFSFGITAAASPIKNDDNASLISSISTFASVRWQGFRFGYSYDFNTTALLNTGGIHEFSISYDFDINIRALERYKCVPFF
ncbi:PorP/SprF family type IX secretion system membrane protein [Polaribacter sp. IC073]|uniref:PorP/SprF family type IX secretion system membrane protein n=1 Tax=Polaribacter sp. IC073 TaxID=2508540 RepID=UPI0011BEF36F|nr:PorP/SprF family type IX secretion system membrane protein [Polaribacter sp. IC073]TXD46906.1 type IX secretion system membrane protein PorP/SprF [Polaribacter sp. IC073]